MTQNQADFQNRTSSLTFVLLWMAPDYAWMAPDYAWLRLVAPGCAWLRLVAPDQTDRIQAHLWIGGRQYFPLSLIENSSITNDDHPVMTLPPDHD